MHWILRSPQAEYSTRLSAERAIASLERAMAENRCRGAVTRDYVAIHLPGSDSSTRVGATFTLTAVSTTLAGSRFGALLPALVAVGTWSLLRAASRAMERGIALTCKLIESAFQPLASPSLVLVTRRGKPAA